MQRIHAIYVSIKLKRLNYLFAIICSKIVVIKVLIVTMIVCPEFSWFIQFANTLQSQWIIILSENVCRYMKIISSSDRLRANIWSLQTIVNEGNIGNFITCYKTVSTCMPHLDQINLSICLEWQYRMRTTHYNILNQNMRVSTKLDRTNWNH